MTRLARFAPRPSRGPGGADPRVPVPGAGDPSPEAHGMSSPARAVLRIFQGSQWRGARVAAACVGTPPGGVAGP